MKILMLSWRDMENPRKGGAEVVTDRYLRGLAERGHEVVLFASHFEGAERERKWNGYTLIRAGGPVSVYLYGMLYAWRNRKVYDVIIDQINTIPFFSFLTVPRNRRICFFHQLCRNVWFWEMRAPFSWLGYLFESVYLWFYRKTWTIVVSRSTSEDLRRVGFHSLSVVENAIDTDHRLQSVPEKRKNQLCVVGRLKRSKRVHDCIQAVHTIRSVIPDVHLKVVGVGDVAYEKSLRELVRELDLEESVTFCGHVSRSERDRIMAESEAILVTSVREGWGLIVTEANAAGTPAITYDVHGLRDANRSGLVVSRNTPEELARTAIDFLQDESRKRELSEQSLKSSFSYRDWESRVDSFEKILLQRVQTWK